MGTQGYRPTARPKGDDVAAGRASARLRPTEQRQVLAKLNLSCSRTWKVLTAGLGGSLLDFFFCRSCLACDSPLAWGSDRPWCEGCAISAERAGAAGAVGPLPVWALWVYAGAAAEAIVRAKDSGRALDLSAAARDWRKLLGEAAAQTGAERVCAVAPHRGRLATRGWHLPDQLTRMGELPVDLALERRDDAGVRRDNRQQVPEFTPRRGTARVLLIDDVITTGATLLAASTALQDAGWQPVGCLVLADARPATIATCLARQERGVPSGV